MILRGVFNGTEIAELADEAHRLLERKDLMDPDNIRCRWQDWPRRANAGLIVLILLLT